VKINIEEIVEGLESGGGELSYYLDVRTGETILITEGTRSLLRRTLDDVGEDASREEIAAHLAGRTVIPNWQAEEVLRALPIEFGSTDEFVEIPRMPSHDAYRDMADFIESGANPRFRAQLEDAIDGRKPFRHFKEAISLNDSELERWHVYRDDRMQRRAVEWLADIGIENFET
jgi:hypothetical protein